MKADTASPSLSSLPIPRPTWFRNRIEQQRSAYLNDPRTRLLLHRSDNLKVGAFSLQGEQGSSCCPERFANQEKSESQDKRLPCTCETILTPAVVLGQSRPTVNGHQHFALHSHLGQVQTFVEQVVQGDWNPGINCA